MRKHLLLVLRVGVADQSRQRAEGFGQGRALHEARRAHGQSPEVGHHGPVVLPLGRTPHPPFGPCPGLRLPLCLRARLRHWPSARPLCPHLGPRSSNALGASRRSGGGVGLAWCSPRRRALDRLRSQHLAKPTTVQTSVIVVQDLALKHELHAFRNPLQQLAHVLAPQRLQVNRITPSMMSCSSWSSMAALFPPATLIGGLYEHHRRRLPTDRDRPAPQVAPQPAPPLQSGGST